MPLTAEEITITYQVMLNRLPGPQEVAHMSQHYQDIEGLRGMLLISDEFTGKYAALQRAREAGRPPTLIQIHIPKTGGTTLAEALTYETHLLPNAIYHEDGLDALRALPAVKRRGLRYIRGHLAMGAGAALGLAHRYLTVIRLPGPRIHSFFRFLQRHEDHPAHVAVTGMSFGDYLEYSLTEPDHRAELDNGQLRRLAGRMQDRDFDRPDRYLPEALHNVLRPGTLLGYTEHMPAFLQRLRDAGILSTTQIENHNVAPQSANLDHDIQKMSEYQKQIFQKYTEWDAYFYQICTSIIPPNEG